MKKENDLNIGEITNRENNILLLFLKIYYLY
jgi:hypothetical protein